MSDTTKFYLTGAALLIAGSAALAAVLGPSPWAALPAGAAASGLVMMLGSAVEELRRAVRGETL